MDDLTPRKTKRQSEVKIRHEQNLEVQQRLNANIPKESISTLHQKQHLDNASISNKQAKKDIERHLVKLQRKCKHKFNKSTKLCEYCGKHRFTHI